jgi:TATA-box binding protein (TBP) (component of TFIID and TFIIIB)
MYTDPGVFSCMGIEIGAQALATTIARLSSRGLEYNTDVFAGSMVALNSNKEVNTILDLKGKVIGAQDFSDFAGAQAQFYVMEQNGVDFILDPKEVIFTGRQQCG